MTQSAGASFMVSKFRSVFSLLKRKAQAQQCGRNSVHSPYSPSRSPQIPGDMEMSGSESARNWLIFTGRLTGNWFPCLILPDPMRCHPFHRWGLWGPRPPSCRTESWSGWANSKNPHCFHHCLPSRFVEGEDTGTYMTVKFLMEVQISVQQMPRGG